MIIERHHCACLTPEEVRRLVSMDPNRRSGRRRRRKRSRDNAELLQWAKDDVPAGDEKEQANIGLVIAVITGLVLLFCVYYIFGEMSYEAPL